MPSSKRRASQQMATEAELSRRIRRIKASLVGLGDLRPGTLSEQYNICRGPNCRCKAEPPQARRALSPTQLQPPGQEHHRAHPSRPRPGRGGQAGPLPADATAHRRVDRCLHRVGSAPAEQGVIRGPVTRALVHSPELAQRELHPASRTTQDMGENVPDGPVLRFLQV